MKTNHVRIASKSDKVTNVITSFFPTIKEVMHMYLSHDTDLRDETYVGVWRVKGTKNKVL